MDHQLLVNSIQTRIKPYGISEVVNIMQANVSKFQIDYENESRDQSNYSDECVEPIPANADTACSNTDNSNVDKKALIERI